MPDTEPYSEDNSAHVPRSTDITDQLDTTGLGGPSRLVDVAPIVGEDKRRTAVEAAESLTSPGEPLHSSGVTNVILPGDNNELIVDQERRQAAKDQIIERGEKLREEGVQTPAEIKQERFEAGAAPAGAARRRCPQK